MMKANLGSEKDEIRLVREAVGNGAANPLLITKVVLIRNELAPEFEKQMK